MPRDYDIHNCEECHSRFCIRNSITHHGGYEQPEDSGLPIGYSSRFCSKACKEAWAEKHPGQNPDSIDERIGKGCLKLVFVWPCKLTWLCIKWSCILSWRIMKNKWCWTICSCGMSWVAWKILDKIYAPKDKE